MAKYHRQGGKMGGRHTTLIDAAIEVVDRAMAMSEVTKVIAGHITPGLRAGQHRLKIKEMVGGIIIAVRGSTSIQEIRVYTNDPKKTRGRLEEIEASGGF